MKYLFLVLHFQSVCVPWFEVGLLYTAHIGAEESLLQRSMQRNRGNNRMGKTTDLFKKIRDTKRTFHAKMDTIKDRTGMEKISKSGKNTQKSYAWKNYTKKILMTQITMMV